MYSRPLRRHAVLHLPAKCGDRARYNEPWILFTSYENDILLLFKTPYAVIILFNGSARCFLYGFDKMRCAIRQTRRFRHGPRSTVELSGFIFGHLNVYRTCVLARPDRWCTKRYTRSLANRAWTPPLWKIDYAFILHISIGESKKLMMYGLELCTLVRQYMLGLCNAGFFRRRQSGGSVALHGMKLSTFRVRCQLACACLLGTVITGTAEGGSNRQSIHGSTSFDVATTRIRTTTV